MSKQKRPEIGTVMWDVHENLYYAKQLTEKYERTWGWCLKRPLRRTWEKYLEET